jgi:hypothetical protein
MLWGEDVGKSRDRRSVGRIPSSDGAAFHRDDDMSDRE